MLIGADNQREGRNRDDFYNGVFMELALVCWTYSCWLVRPITHCHLFFTLFSDVRLGAGSGTVGAFALRSWQAPWIRAPVCPEAAASARFGQHGPGTVCVQPYTFSVLSRVTHKLYCRLKPAPLMNSLILQPHLCSQKLL